MITAVIIVFFDFFCNRGVKLVMNITKMVLTVAVLFGLNTMACQALDFIAPKIEFDPIATPTTIKVNLPEGEFKLISTSTPTPTTKLKFVPRQVITIRPISSLAISPTPTGVILSPTPEPTITNTPTESQKIEATPTTEIVTETKEEKNDQNNPTTWFLVATVGLLVLIILFQAWPKNKKPSDN